MDRPRSAQMQVAMTSFLALFSIVGIALYGLPFFYDFWVQDFGWTRAQVTSGNAYSKLFIGPLFGFVAGYMIDKFGPRRMMMTGVVMAGGALIGLSLMSGLFLDFLPLLLVQCAGLRLRGTVAKPGFAVALVRQIARQSDGLRLRWHRHWRNNCAVARRVAHQ
jgi:MFS family permease